VIADIREAPSVDWIADVRRRYHVERTVDLELTAKLQRRSRPVVPLAGLVDIRARLERFLRAKLSGDFAIRNLAYLSGGASKEQFVFELDYVAGGAKRTDKLVLRRDPPEAVTATHREREFQLFQALQGIVPVPRARWLDEPGEFFGRSSLICDFAPGVQKPTNATGNITGIGILFTAESRQRIADEFIGALAKIHTADFSRADLSAFDILPAGSSAAVQCHLDWWARVWFEDRLEEEPLMAIAENWLRRNAPSVDVISLIHGDYRSGNFLFDEATNTITAILDWELAHFGDRHCDLAWILFEVYWMNDEQGQTLCCGMLPREEMIALYERKCGLIVDRERLRYYEVFMRWKATIICLATSPRVALGGRTHHDILANWLAGVSFLLLEALRKKLGEVL
jgi:aminoglycoside phosphotransferase (APT) family kinase protein